MAILLQVKKYFMVSLQVEGLHYSTFLIKRKYSTLMPVRKMLNRGLKSISETKDKWKVSSFL